MAGTRTEQLQSLPLLPIRNDLIDRALESGDASIAEEAIREVDLQLASIDEMKDKAGLLLGKAVLNGFLHRYSDARRQLTLALEQARMILKSDSVTTSLMPLSTTKRES